MILTCTGCGMQRREDSAPRAHAGRQMTADCPRCQRPTRHFIGTPAKTNEPSTLKMR